MSKLKSAMFKKQPMIVFLYKETFLLTNQLRNLLSRYVVWLLQDFDDVFHDENPKVLPPIQDIEHQMKFILGTTFPNYPSSRSNLEKMKYLQRQVSELIENGTIWESISLRAVAVVRSIT